MKNLVLVTMMVASLSACVSNKKDKANTAAAQSAGYASGQSDAQSNAVKAANLMIELQANVVGSSETISVVKFAKDNPNLVVIKDVSSSTTAYLAVDVSTYTAGTSWSTYLSTNPTLYVYLTANADGTFSCSTGCGTLSGGSIVSTSNSMVFEKTTAASKDLDKAAAIVEAYQVEKAANAIAAQFGLSDERSIKVAKLASSWNKLAKTRALTDADADAFAKELTGVSMADMNNAEQAMIGGSMTEMNAVISKAAAVNDTTSENMTAIMNQLFN